MDETRAIREWRGRLMRGGGERRGAGERRGKLGEQRETTSQTASSETHTHTHKISMYFFHWMKKQKVRMGEKRKSSVFACEEFLSCSSDLLQLQFLPPVIFHLDDITASARPPTLRANCSRTGWQSRRFRDDVLFYVSPNCANWPSLLLGSR